MKALALLFSLASVAVGSAQTTKPTIVLVHGAFADGSSWAKVIPILEGDGYTVFAVQNPLTSLADDVATTKRVIDAQKGPVVVVGHSYGGAVITAAAAGNPNVKALVYVAAFAPEADEVLAAPGAKFPPPALSSALVPDAAGFLYIDRAKFHDVILQGCPGGGRTCDRGDSETRNGSVFTASVPGGAWKTIPSGTSSRPKIGRSIPSSSASTPSASARRPPRSSRATCRFCRTRKKSPRSSRRQRQRNRSRDSVDDGKRRRGRIRRHFERRSL